MSFEDVSQRLNELQESNRQLRDLIERLATLKFQAGSIPLKDEEDNSVVGELKSEIQQIIREQFDDFAILEEDVEDLKQVTRSSELLAQKSDLEQAVQRAEKELKGYAQNPFGPSSTRLSRIFWQFLQTPDRVSKGGVNSKR